MPLLWLLLAAGAVYAVANSSSGGVNTLRLDAYGRREGGPDGASEPDYGAPGGEKFMDPLYLVWGDGPWKVLPKAKRRVVHSPDDVWRSLGTYLHYQAPGNPIDSAEVPSIGYEYLSGIPTNGAARIARLREVMAARRKDKASLALDKSPSLKAIVQESEKELNNIALSIGAKYKRLATDVKHAGEVAAKLGVSSKALQDEASKLLASGASGVSLVQKTLKEYGPVAQVVANAILGGYDTYFGGGGKLEKETKYVELAASLAIYVPYAGPFISAALGAAASMNRAQLEENLKRCKGLLEKVSSLVKLTNDLQVPNLWHLEQIFPATCAEDNYPGWTTRVALSAAMSNFEIWKSIPVASATDTDRIEVSHWWGLAMQYMSHPEVREVFELLGYDAGGGSVASDEQVLLVAAPIAVANGFDVDAFAAELWNACPGWRGAYTPAMHQWDRSFCDERIDCLVKKIPFTSAEPGEYEVLGKDFVGKSSAPQLSDCGCVIPTNAWQLQWIALTRAAFKLVPEFATKTGKVLTLKPNVGVLKGLKIA
jgi:hypothetical protein